MARAGLEPDWHCLFANDFDERKCDVYRANWGAAELVAGDVGKLETSQLPQKPDLIWASFPCQDLSLAGGGAGLRGERSGTFWPFWSIVKRLRQENRHPDIVVLENVIGTLTSHGGDDFRAICAALRGEGYKFGAVLIDAELFLPHSRPRLFVVGVKASSALAPNLVSQQPVDPWHPRSLRAAYDNLPEDLKNEWVWWSMASPSRRNITLESIIEIEPENMRWHDQEETNKLIAMMAPLHKQKLKLVSSAPGRRIGTIYRRTRRDENGFKIQRAEVRFDDIAGCLRTPAGGSSRQVVLEVLNGRVRSRLISARETARLMGLPDSYILPHRYNEAYHVTGDGVAVPVVRYLSRSLLIPILSSQEHRQVA